MEPMMPFNHVLKVSVTRCCAWLVIFVEGPAVLMGSVERMHRNTSSAPVIRTMASLGAKKR